MKLVLIGSPGAGKGTQAKVLSKHFDIAHISTGDLLREEINLKTELGLKIIDIMNAGELVSDEIVEALLSNRIKKDDCKNGFILDGYPRNVEQAEGLPSIVGEIDKVVLISVEDDLIIERMVGRRGCPKCGQMYHIKYNPPKEDGICSECGTALVQRKDDNEETVKNRLSVYHTSTSPIIDYYKNKGLLLEINGVGNIDDISKQLIDALEGAK
ncbi:adenylate kinase [uncultured Tyzzerella sp.]|uniref:adenylate kinase n=1 Tax=uncultured Tyzzerella sp. TaxID=2321398 RepID=UPI002943A6C0|nr:adenylate kinase [uncultured Tyzzerella sp.]